MICTCGLGLLIFPFIRKCPVCGHSYWLNDHQPHGSQPTNVNVPPTSTDMQQPTA